MLDTCQDSTGEQIPTINGICHQGDVTAQLGQTTSEVNGGHRDATGLSISDDEQFHAARQNRLLMPSEKVSAEPADQKLFTTGS